MNVEKNIRGRQRVLVTVWIWHIVLILYILFIYSNSMRPAVQSSAESGRILRFLQKLAAESGVAVPWLTEHIVRKCAHFIEYTGLGMLLRQSDACVRRNRTVSSRNGTAKIAIRWIFSHTCPSGVSAHILPVPSPRSTKSSIRILQSNQ